MLGLYWGYIGVILGLYWGILRVECIVVVDMPDLAIVKQRVTILSTLQAYKDRCDKNRPKRPDFEKPYDHS